MEHFKKKYAPAICFILFIFAVYFVHLFYGERHIIVELTLFLLLFILGYLFFKVVVVTFNTPKNAKHFYEFHRDFNIVGLNLILFSIILPVGFSMLYSSVQWRTECIKGYEELYDSLYFSYTTITTLGYGDLTPIGICKIFTSVESVIGLISFGFLTAAIYSVLANKH